MTGIDRLADMDADLRRVLASIGAPIVEALPLSSTVEPRAFRLTTARGHTLKLRKVRTTRQAEIEAYVLDAFDGEGFPRLRGRAGRWLLLSWIEGVPASAAFAGEDLVRRCASLQSRVHRLPPPPASCSAWRTPDQRVRRIATHLDRLCRARQLAAAAAERALEIARRHVPPSAPTGLGHGDFCGENIVVAVDGLPFVVDNETSAVMPLDHDLARTWYRWPMPPSQWRAYLDEYATFRDPSTFLSHFPYWGLMVLAASAVLRLERAGWSPQDPLQRLGAMLRSVEDGCAPERLAFAP